MNFKIKLHHIRSVDKIESYWTKEDYIKLLELFDYTDAQNLPESELIEMLFMAITDFEPEEASEILLNYKLKDVLKEGQIKSLSHEMLTDKVAEEYPNIALHYPLFNINQLLYAAYNGKFPKTLASIIDIELHTDQEITVTKEIILRTISDLLSEKSLLKRLFNDQLDAETELKDAESIIWELTTTGDHTYQLISSDYWLNKEDFEIDEFKGILKEEEISHHKKTP
ncbi:MAG: hypothetical protein HKN99_07805 [Winogradskyella sp.]|nr:hypothetical protein [Winogradskyella sp.]NNC45770.1 hypothetical protein [Winogradskyella sp.]NNL82813.1 hypothetical protein [Winogradskyella sp.]